MQVRIKDNKGSQTIQIMNDLGDKNDKSAFDGIYTAQLPPIIDQSIIGGLRMFVFSYKQLHPLLNQGVFIWPTNFTNSSDSEPRALHIPIYN